MTQKNNEEKVSIQSELAALSELLAWFQSDEFSLEEAVTKYTEAQQRAEKIEKDLSTLKNEIHVIKQRFEA